MAPTSPASSGRSVGIIRSRNEVTDFLVIIYYPDVEAAYGIQDSMTKII
jgi:hypothetical protein